MDGQRRGGGGPWREAEEGGLGGLQVLGQLDELPPRQR